MTGLTIDQCLDKIGSLGWYQARLILILSYIEWVNIGFQVMLLTFVASEPPWICVNNDTCPFKGDMKPGVEGYKLRCNLNRSDWKFNDDFTSVVTEFELVCENTFLASLTSSVIFAGWLISSLASGVISDKIGRKPVLFIFAFATALFAVIGAFPKVYWFFTLCRLLVGIGVGACAMPTFVIATEFVGVHHRHIAGTSLWYSWAFSLMSLAGIAYLVRDWRTLSIICAVPGFIIIAAWWFVPESARFLILKGKVKETEEILRKIARVNKKEFPTEPLSDRTTDGKQNLGDLRDLFRTKRMIHRTLVSWYSWFVNALVYYGVSFSSPSLGGNMYFNFFLTSVIEIPGNYAAIYFMGKFGRKKTLVFGLIAAALASVGSALITMKDPGNDGGFYAGQIVMAMSAKFFVMLSFATIYVYSAELFPTVIRNVGLGSSTAAARLGSFSAPYVVTLNRIYPLLPFGIMATKALLAGLLCITLPETKGKPTEETMDDITLAVNNAVRISDLEGDEGELAPKRKDGENEEKSAGKIQTEKNKLTAVSDAPMADDNIVAVDEVNEEGLEKLRGEEKEERKESSGQTKPQNNKPNLDSDAPMAADNYVAVDEDEKKTTKQVKEEEKLINNQTKEGEQTKHEESEKENTSF